MIRKLTIILGAAMFVLLLAVSILWLSADRLLDEVVRPWIAERAAAELGTEVRLERLTYADGRLVLAGLSLNRPQEFLLSVESVDIRFSWPGLMNHRINEVIIRRPQMTWSAVADSEKKDGEVALPSAPPMRIDAWHVEDGRLELHWGERQLLISRLVAAGGLDRQFPLTISALCGPVPGVPMHLNGNVTWQKGPVLNLDELAWNDKNLLTQPLVLTPDFDLSGGVRLGLDKLDDADVAGLFAAIGEPLPWPAGVHWQLATLGIEFSLEQDLLASRLSTGQGSLQISGKRLPWQNLELQVKGSLEQMNLAGSLNLAGSTSLTLNGTWAGRQLNGELDVNVGQLASLLQSAGMDMPTFAATPQDLKLHGKIEAAQDKVLVSDIRLVSRLGGKGRLEGKIRGAWQDKRLMLACDRLAVSNESSGSLAEGALSVRGDPAAEDWQGEWSLKVADVIDLAKLNGAKLADRLPNIQDLSMQGRLQWRKGQLHLPGVTLAGQLTGPDLSARLRGKLELDMSSEIDLAVSFNSLSVESLEYQTTDGMTGLTGGRIGLQGQLSMVGEKLNFNLSGQAGVTEALVQSWYGNLAALPLSFSVSGSWSGAQHRFDLTAADFDLAGMISSHSSGFFTAKGASFQAKLDVPHLEGDFRQRLQELAGELLPEVKRLSMEGRLQIGGSLLKEVDRWSLDLQLTPLDVSLGWDQTVQLERLRGQLPIHLRNYGPATDKPSEEATLAWSGLQANLVKTGPGHLDLLASPNRWRQMNPLELAVAGGTVRMTSLQLDLPKLTPQLKASLELVGIELPQISQALELPEMAGELSARLEEIQVSNDEIETVGGASVQAFGGSFVIHNMRVQAPFSRFPTYHADVDFNGVDLYKLTNTFEFGEINGIVDGYVHELRLFDGIPSAFKAKVETRDEGTRNISVKAIRNLNTLSQGGLSAALSQGVYRFIDFYHYRKIGILCSLQNDLFHLEGTGRSDSNQYLIYGGLLPPRIDVVISSPTISFKEMVKRLKRIERTER
jgi:translocation and assembly module TamB